MKRPDRKAGFREREGEEDGGEGGSTLGLARSENWEGSLVSGPS